MHFVDVEINAHYCVHVGWHKLLLCRTELSVSALRCDCNSSQRGCSTLILSSVCKRFRFYPEQFFLCTFLNGSSADYLRLSRKKSYNRDELKNKNMAQKPTPRSHTPLQWLCGSPATPKFPTHQQFQDLYQVSKVHRAAVVHPENTHTVKSLAVFFVRFYIFSYVDNVLLNFYSQYKRQYIKDKVQLIALLVVLVLARKPSALVASS